MTTSNVAYNSYYEHECRWGDATYDTYITIAPNLYRWDAYDVYASASYTETLTEPNGTTGSWSFSKSVSTSGGYSWLDNFSTRTYQRKESAYTITLKLTFNAGSSWSGSYHSVNSSATFTLTVPALSSVNVAFNANNGSGAPSTQKKYKGKTLTLSSTIPTRTGYNFLGWSTTQARADAKTIDYQPGGSYTTDTAVTLYASWEQAIVPPTVTITAYRTATSSATTETGDGAYVYTKADWAKGDNNVTNVQYRYKTDTGSWSSWANCSGTRTGSSGTAYKAGIALATSSYMTVEIQATDGTVTTTVSTVVSTVNFPIKFYDQDKTLIHDLYLKDTTNRFGDTGLDQYGYGTLTQRYTSNSAALEQGVFWCCGDTVTLSFKFVNGSNAAIGYTNSAWSIPEEYAPPTQILFPIFTTTSGWADFIVGCAVLGSDGYVHWWTKAMAVVFGSVTYVRKPANWVQPE